VPTQTLEIVGFSPRKQRLIRNRAKCKAAGAKPQGRGLLAARLKPCPDTKHTYAQGFGFRKSCDQNSNGATTAVSPIHARAFYARSGAEDLRPH